MDFRKRFDFKKVTKRFMLDARVTRRIIQWLKSQTAELMPSGLLSLWGALFPDQSSSTFASAPCLRMRDTGSSDSQKCLDWKDGRAGMTKSRAQKIFEGLNDAMMPEMKMKFNKRVSHIFYLGQKVQVYRYIYKV